MNFSVEFHLKNEFSLLIDDGVEWLRFWGWKAVRGALLGTGSYTRAYIILIVSRVSCALRCELSLLNKQIPVQLLLYLLVVLPPCRIRLRSTTSNL